MERTFNDDPAVSRRIAELEHQVNVYREHLRATLVNRGMSVSEAERELWMMSRMTPVWKDK